MPKLLDRAPFQSAAEVVVRGERVRVRANQIVVWLSLTLERVKSPSPLAVPFPAVLDTGHTHALALHERHLREWAGLRPDVLAERGATRERGRRVPLRVANVWAHPTGRGAREPAVGHPPHWLSASESIAVYPGDDFPRLPILGLRAIADNALTLTIDGRRRTATLRTARRWWPF